MKKVWTLILACASLFAWAQPKKVARMAPVYKPGYYLNNKGDTLKGQIEINPVDPTDFYRQFAFISGKSKKPKVIMAGQTKAYGFNDRHFVTIVYDGQKLFVERLTYGRLRFYEYQFNGKVNGAPGIESEYYIRDAQAEGVNPELSDPKKFSPSFYKKALKPYLEDQPMLWSDLDKYHFDRNKVVQTLNEFNQIYAPKPAEIIPEPEE